ncbi:hypothetical protein KSP40_PGU005577 [Platanthera guangdongensis]|uniref:Dirigent protein n=1 Tax=Platanthera guangdongensis TaxID=2320717 RepID=A0ABR2LV35_9ASPA
MATIKTLLLIFVMAISTASVISVHDSFFEKTKNSEKYTHIHLYVHIAFSGSNPSAVTVVHGPTNKTLEFGDITMVDIPMTEGPELSSKLIGREQGTYIGVSRDPESSKAVNLISVILVFTDGAHKNNTIALTGRDPIFSVERELIVVGGTGAFRLARGYSIWKIYSRNLTGNAVIEADIYVFHY